MSTHITQIELEPHAADIIRYLKNVQEFSDIKIAVIGGLARWKYDLNGDSTSDIDLFFDMGVDSSEMDETKKVVQAKLIALPNSKFVKDADIFYFQPSVGQKIQFDIIPKWLVPYVPPTATKLRHIRAGRVPYIPVVDLLLFKMHSCGLRDTFEKRDKDVKDAIVLLQKLVADASSNLTNAQRDFAEPLIEGVASLSTSRLKQVGLWSGAAEPWWRMCLDLLARREAQSLSWLFRWGLFVVDLPVRFWFWFQTWL